MIVQLSVMAIQQINNVDDTRRVTPRLARDFNSAETINQMESNDYSTEARIKTQREVR